MSAPNKPRAALVAVSRPMDDDAMVEPFGRLGSYSFSRSRQICGEMSPAAWYRLLKQKRADGVTPVIFTATLGRKRVACAASVHEYLRSCMGENNET